MKERLMSVARLHEALSAELVNLRKAASDLQPSNAGQDNVEEVKTGSDNGTGRVNDSGLLQKAVDWARLVLDHCGPEQRQSYQRQYVKWQSERYRSETAEPDDSIEMFMWKGLMDIPQRYARGQEDNSSGPSRSSSSRGIRAPRSSNKASKAERTARARAAAHGVPWTHEEDAALLHMLRRGNSSFTISMVKLTGSDRTPGAVRARMTALVRKHGIRRPRSGRFDGRASKLVELIDAGGSDVEIKSEDEDE